MPEKIVLKVEGMSCGHCKMAVKNVLQGLDGVLEVTVNLEDKKAEVVYDETKAKKGDLIEAISKEGYSAT